MGGASVSMPRRVEWIDTDAGGTWHHSTALRWAEEAETELHRRLGIVDLTFGAIPRVRVEFDFKMPLFFGDAVEVLLEVAEVGGSSIHYGIEIVRDGRHAVSGRVVAVLVDRATGLKRTWPDEWRRALTAR